MGYNSAVRTSAGNELLSRVMAGETTITFTKLATSEEGIDTFTIKQELVPSSTKFVRNNKTGVILDGVFNNVSVVTGYYINTIGIYAKDSDDNEVLFSYLTADDTPTYMEAYNGQVPFSIRIQVESGISLDDGSLIIIDPQGVATIEYVNEKIEVLENKLKSCIVVTIPIDNWVTETDSDNVDYYTREIAVAGMTADYVGTNCIDYVRPDPYNVAAEAEAKALLGLIENVESMVGKIKVTCNVTPTKPFQIYLYGV